MASFTINTDRFKTKGTLFPRLLQITGLLGVLFYAIGPVFFPDVPIRQPELLPVYTLMMGLGELLKRPEDSDDSDSTTSKDSRR